MPKIPTDNTSPLETAMEAAAGPMATMHAGYPMLLCGVARKINIGNFENVDVYAAISVPVMALPGEDLEAFKKAVTEAAELGFHVASKETATRYAQIKEMQRGRQQK